MSLYAGTCTELIAAMQREEFRLTEKKHWRLIQPIGGGTGPFHSVLIMERGVRAYVSHSRNMP